MIRSPSTTVRSSAARLIPFMQRFLGRSQTTVVTASSVSSGYNKEDVMNLLQQKPNEKDDMAYSLSFGDGSSNIFSSMAEPSALMQQQLRYSQDQLRHDSHHSRLSVSASVKVTKKAANVDTSALPRTLRDVRRQKSRAIVVTETTKPFRVVDVNECWEGLCGFTLSEARGQTLGKLLKGPATNQVAATGLVTHLLHGDEAGAVLTNYTKNGREFRNRIRVGPLYDDETGTRITHFVGVLEEIIDEDLQQEAM